MKAVRFIKSGAFIFSFSVAILNAFIALTFASFTCGQLSCEIIWPIVSGICTLSLAYFFWGQIKVFKLTHQIIACSVFLVVEIYVSVAVIYPSAYILTFGPYQKLQHDICCETPTDYGAEHYETLKITLSDQVQIEGWFVPAHESKATIILIHGSENDRRHASDQAKFLLQAGYGVFMYDQRGNGQSEGAMDLVNPRLGHDLVDIAHWLKNEKQIQQLGVVGLSLGAHAALSAAAQEPQLFSALWLDGLQPQTLSDFPKDLSWMQRAENQLMFAQFKWLNLIRKPDAEFYESVIDQLPKLKQLPIYLVAGEGEKFEADANHRFAQMSHDNLHVWMVPDGGHLTAVSDFPDDYQTRMISFFENANLKRFNITELHSN